MRMSVTVPVEAAASLDQPAWGQWLALSCLAAVVAVPVFEGMPSGVKLLGLHSAGLAAGLGWLTRRLALLSGVRSRPAILALAVLLAIGSFGGLLTLGDRDLAQAVDRPIPLPPPAATSDPAQVARHLQLVERLRAAAQPKFTDYLGWRYQSLRVSARWVIPLTIAEALGGIVVAAVIAVRRQSPVAEEMTSRPV